MNRTELCEVTGLSQESVGQWAKKPGCPKKKQGTAWVYEWPAWGEWRTQELVRTAREGAPRDANYEKAKARRETAVAGQEELKLRHQRGELVEVSQFRDVLGGVVDVLARKLKAYPAKWSPLLVGCKTQAEVRKRLKPAVAELLAELAPLEVAADREEAA